ncbi:hypothetical protein OGAPHI_005421 [Ogataea philodendri]|uniref:Uncharacterized protein n=1 Tax=Ogataea philodendri TaxID=1378263 RepID=A0A9P8NYC9_9ASCO|nr:uncharacterized protein OGAPHI_005421 [Ogataea philodendri]KAH3662173.1 hypothetical protein OGAPHI_005421 [Ogataea philodendri]
MTPINTAIRPTIIEPPAIAPRACLQLSPYAKAEAPIDHPGIPIPATAQYPKYDKDVQVCLSFGIGIRSLFVHLSFSYSESSSFGTAKSSDIGRCSGFLITLTIHGSLKGLGIPKSCSFQS